MWSNGERLCLGATGCGRPDGKRGDRGGAYRARLLMHHVRLAGEQVVEYEIVAPTEWNFHPDGAFAQDMRGVDETDEESLKQLAHIAALSLDPCVAYESGDSQCMRCPWPKACCN
jgi:hypothetical protein